jgi:hypothetical protein
MRTRYSATGLTGRWRLPSTLTRTCADRTHMTDDPSRRVTCCSYTLARSMALTLRTSVMVLTQRLGREPWAAAPHLATARGAMPRIWPRAFRVDLLPHRSACTAPRPRRRTARYREYPAARPASRGRARVAPRGRAPRRLPVTAMAI